MPKAIIIKKKRGKKSTTQTQSQTYPSISRQSDSQAVLMQSDSTTSITSTPSKIDDIKVAIEKIDDGFRCLLFSMRINFSLFYINSISKES